MSDSIKEYWYLAAPYSNPHMVRRTMFDTYIREIDQPRGIRYVPGFFGWPVYTDPWIGMHVRIDDYTAVCADGTRLRLTPPGPPTAPVVVQPGDVVVTSYGSGPYIVEEVVGPHTEGGYPPHYTLVCTMVHPLPGRPRGTRFWLNELVAQDGRLLALFEVNHDEVFVVGHRWPRRGYQPALFDRPQEAA
jgi:hypothetical protein